MNDLRTDFEKYLTDVIEDMERYFDKGLVTKVDYQRLRGKIRDIRQYLDNRMFGCPTGRHKGNCEKVRH